MKKIIIDFDVPKNESQCSEFDKWALFEVWVN